MSKKKIGFAFVAIAGIVVVTVYAIMQNDSESQSESSGPPQELNSSTYDSNTASTEDKDMATSEYNIKFGKAELIERYDSLPISMTSFQVMRNVSKLPYNDRIIFLEEMLESTEDEEKVRYVEELLVAEKRREKRRQGIPLGFENIVEEKDLESASSKQGILDEEAEGEAANMRALLSEARKILDGGTLEE